MVEAPYGIDLDRQPVASQQIERRRGDRRRSGSVVSQFVCFGRKPVVVKISGRPDPLVIRKPLVSQ